MATEIDATRAAAQAAADLKSLEMLFEYTKFHIGLYLTLAAAYIAVATVKVGEQLLVDVDRTYLRFAVGAIAVAGVAGGVIASSITQCECASATAFLKQDIGPWSLRFWSAKTWTSIEHTSFWVGIIFALFSLRPPNRAESGG